MKLLRTIHKWLGFSLSFFIILSAISGLILIFKESILRAAHPYLSAAITETQKSGYPEIITKIESQFQDPSVTFLRFPREGMNVFHLWLSDGAQAFIDPISAEINKQWYWYESFTNILFQLHTHLFSGDIGEIIVGCIGLAVIFFLISGVLLWWPRRRLFKFKEIIPSSKHLMRSHYTVGVFFSPIILIPLVTGITMVFYLPIAHIVTNTIDSSPPLLPNKTIEFDNHVIQSWTNLLNVVNTTLPEGEILSWTPPNANNAAYIFRKRMPEEWHPYGRTFIVINPYNLKIVQTIDARQQQTGMKIMEKVYPLHAVTVGGVFYKILAVLAAISLTTLSVLGMFSFIKKYKKQYASSRPQNIKKNRLNRPS